MTRRVPSRAEKIVTSLLVTSAVTVMPLGTALPAFALSPPRLGMQTALLVPLAHWGMRRGCPDWGVLLLAGGPLVAVGVYLGHQWIRGHLLRGAMVVGTVYGCAVGAALLRG